MNIVNGRYKVIANIKDDSTNSLYLVSDLYKENKKMALKIINSTLISQKAIDFLKREYVTLTTLSHPNLMEVYDFGIIDNVDGSNITSKQYFCTYEYIKGKNIFNATEGLNSKDIICFLLQLCSALIYLHRRGYSYRNLDVRNIIVDENNGTPTVKLLGVAGNEEIEKAVFKLKKAGNQFRAPEILKNDEGTEVSDLYSLGVLIFCLITRKNPDRINFLSAWSQYKSIAFSNCTSFEQAEKCKQFINLMDKLVSKNPEERFQTVNDLLKALEENYDIDHPGFERKPFEKVNTKTKLIGRDENLEQLMKWRDTALSNDSSKKLMLIHGEAGIGKTRLLKEFSFYSGLDKVRVFYSNCSENQKNSYKPILQVLKQMIPMAPLEILEKYQSELIKVLPDEKCIQGVMPSPALPDEKEELRLKIRISSFITAVLEKQPSVLIIDNAQWIDGATLELMDYMNSCIRQIPAGIIVSDRKDEFSKNKTGCFYVNKWRYSGVLHEMSLPRFDFEETREFIKNILSIKYSPTAFCTEIFRYTEGNPGFIKDAITALSSEGKLYIDENGQWCTDFDDEADYSRLYIPASMHEAVWKHINTLNEEYYKILEVLSVFNMPVSSEVIERVSMVSQEQVKNTIMELISYQIVEQRLADWGYTYDLYSKSTKNEIYEKIGSVRRKDYHIRAAIVLDELFKTEDRVNKDELIYHYTKSGEKKKALEFIIQSADRMLKLHINTQALAYLRKALQISKEVSSFEDTIRILLMMGELYRRKGENNKAFECYHEVLKHALDMDDKFTIAKVKEMMGALYTRKNEFDKALVLLEESQKLSEEIGYIECYLETVRRICWVYIFRRKNKEAIEMIHKVLREHSEEVYSYYHAELYNVLGTHYLELSNVQEALHCYNKSIELFENNGEKVEIAYPLNNIATVFAEFLNDNEKAREYFQKSLEINIASNLVEGITSCYDNLGETCRLEDDYEKALEYYFKGEEKAVESELNALLFTLSKNILLAYLELDEYQKSYEYLIRTENEIEKNPDRGLDLQIYYEYAARYYYEIGVFEKAKVYAEMGVEACRKAGLPESIGSREIMILTDHILAKGSSESLTQEMRNLFETCKDTARVKDQREVIHRFAEVLISSGNVEEASRLLEESQQLSVRFNTKRLEIEYLYLEGKCIGSYEGIKTIEKALELNEKYRNLRMMLKGYQSVGDMYFALKEKKLAAVNYLKAMDLLYKLVNRVPKEYQKQFLYSHNRFALRERLLSIKADSLTEQKHAIERQITKRKFREEDLLKFFFGNINYEMMFYEIRGSSGLQGSSRQITGLNPEVVNKIKNVLMSTSKDYLRNLKGIIDTACALTSAETGYILQYNDKGELDILTNSEYNVESNYFTYIIGHIGEKDKYIFMTDTFGKKLGNADIILPGEIKAVMCIPIYSYNSEEKYSTGKRKTGPLIKGYIYLSTDTIFNHFTLESFEACKVLANQASLQMENYNLKIISTVDKLTGVYNRKYFENMIHVQLNKAQKEKAPLSILMMDIDKFKSINDNFGHQKGDEILNKIGSIFLDNIRSADICCRYGGEEFVILLPDTDINKAEVLAERVRCSVEKARLMGNEANLTISIGISAYPKHGEWWDELIGKADQALYYAKESGRNQYCTWNSKLKKLTKRMDKLAGIITGNVVEDQRNVLAMLEIIQLINENISEEEKISRMLESVIEAFDADYGMLLMVVKPKNIIGKCFTRKKYVNGWIYEEKYNRKIIEKVLKTKTGTYMADWDNINNIDNEAGEPIVQSVLVEPVIKNKAVKGILYLSCPINQKEYGFSELNFLNTIANIVTMAFSQEKEKKE